MTMIIDGTNGLTFPDTSKQYNSYYNFKNRIINGAMVIDQRNAGASVTPTSGQYLVDRFQVTLTQASKFTAQRNAGSVTPPAGFTNYLGLTVGASANVSLAAGDLFTVGQQIEGFNAADLGWGAAGASTVTLSFWARSSVTGTHAGNLQNYAQTQSYVFTYTISAANTWEYKTITIAGSTAGVWATDNTSFAYVRFNLGVGTTYQTATTNAWVSGNFWSTSGAVTPITTNGATFYITGVQLEKGTQATSFDYRAYGTELALCQRYFVKDLQDNTQAMFLVGVVESSTKGDRCGMRLPVPMRATPTAAVGGTSNPRIYDGSASPAITSISGNASSSFGACLNLTASGGGLTVGRPAIIIDNSASFFTYSAEL
jgi:hypothetical protein